MIEVGKRYYFIQHTYHHYIGEVVEITGKRSCVLRPTNKYGVVKIHRCSRGWTEFFQNGMMTDTEFDIIPEHHIEDFQSATLWKHDIPLKKERNAARR